MVVFRGDCSAGIPACGTLHNMDHHSSSAERCDNRAPLCLMQVQIYMQRGHGSPGEREGLKSVLGPVRNTHGDIAQAAGGAANGALRIQLRRLRGQRLRQSVTGRAHGGVRPLRWRFLQQQMQPTSDSSLLHNDAMRERPVPAPERGWRSSWGSTPSAIKSSPATAGVTLMSGTLLFHFLRSNYATPQCCPATQSCSNSGASALLSAKQGRGCMCAGDSHSPACPLAVCGWDSTVLLTACSSRRCSCH